MAGVTTSLVGDVLTSTVYGAGDGNVLVVVSLRGGADGLSLLVPHAEPAYYSARPRTAIARARLDMRDDTFGLHPAFEPLLPFWTAGKVAAVHATGLPAPNRSHFAAMEEVEDANPWSSVRSGWLNRLVGTDADAGPQPTASATARTAVPANPALALTKTGALPAGSTGRAGDVVTFSFTLRNSGNQTVTGATITELLPTKVPAPTLEWCFRTPS